MINLASISDSFAYIRSNGWTIVFFLGLVAWTKSYVIDPQIKQYRQTQSYKEATNPSRVATLEQDMRRVRLAQQEEANRRAIEAAAERKLKEAELLKKRHVKDPKKSGRKLGSGTSKDNSHKKDYNPMMPGGSHVSSYKPARRQVNKGG